MPFTGLSFNDLFNFNLVQEDVAAAVAALSPKETPFLDFIGDSSVFATNVKHEYVQDYNLPNYLIASTAIASATTATAFQVNGLGNALSVGQILENETSAELMQISSIVGDNSIVVTRNYASAGVGSLAAGGQLYVREMAGIEGADHNGADVHRFSDRQANTVGLFRMELAQSDTQSGINIYGSNSWEQRKAKGLVDILHQLEKAIVRGRLNTTNSLGTATATRTMRGLRDHISTVNSTVTASSFAANPHLYVGNVWEQMWNNGASESETWAIIAGSTYFRNLSDLNDTKVQDSNTSDLYQRRVRRYAGPFGEATMFLSRVLKSTEAIIVPRERIRIVPLQGRSFAITDMAKTGDNSKALLTGEYTIEVHHQSAMGRILS